MKRIFCTLSITLLLSCAYTLEAGKKKKKGNQNLPVGTVAGASNDSDINTVATQSPNTALLLKQSLARLKDLQERRKNLDEAIAQEKEIQSELTHKIKLATVLPEIRAGIKLKKVTPEVLEDGWVAPDDTEKETSSGGWLSSLWGTKK